MTFALLGRCPETGQLGVAVTTSDLAVGARVPFAIAGLAVAVTQHRTDPRLGPRALELVRSGCTPQEAVDAVAASTPHRDWRQVAVLTADGTHAAYNGAGVTPQVAALAGDDCLAVGNMLAGDDVAPAMVAGFAHAGGPLAQKLVAGLEAGEQAGGETGTLRSAALLVVHTGELPARRPAHRRRSDPARGARTLWETYAPWTRDFVTRARPRPAATGRPGDHHSSTTT